MAVKPSPFFLFLLLLIPLLSNSINAANSSGVKPKPFDFIKNLQGCHKGEKVKGLHDLKRYLERFGYLSYHHSNNSNSAHADDDDFDNQLESALKTYQINYRLNPTGTLDAKTVEKMIMPRCGVPDVVNRTTSMHHHRPSSIHAVSHYTFFPGSPRWPASKTRLTYGFLPGTRAEISPICARAFATWSRATHFTFQQIQNYMAADIKISFHRGNHGDGSPFDGPGGTLAHAFAPTDGRFHYDADERWANGAVQGAFDLETVALHEIGHLLGLDHSKVEDAILFSGIPSGTKKGLHADDIQGIRALYNV